MKFAQLKANPLGRPPMASNAAYIDFTTRFFSSFRKSSLPSPAISTVKDFSSKTCAAKISRTSRAKPNESKPGPRFALVAGIEIDTAAALNAGFVDIRVPTLRLLHVHH